MEEAGWITVHEWEHGKPRPTTARARKARDTAIDNLELPPGSFLPQVGDVVLLYERGDLADPTPFRVIARDFTWRRAPGDDPQKVPARWRGVLLHVRRLTADEYEAEPDAE